MFNTLGQNYPYKLERCGPGLIKQRYEVKNYNIITCIDNPGKTRASESLPAIPQTKLRKLGDYVDFPHPKNKKNQEALIDFNNKNKDQQQSNLAEAGQKSLTNPQFEASNLMNSSSIKYNFINNTASNFPKTTKELRSEHQNISNRTKQIGSIYDYGRLFAPNFNQEYQTFFKTNDHAFNRNKGMCADTYNQAYTYGPDIKPFRKFK